MAFLGQIISLQLTMVSLSENYPHYTNGICLMFSIKVEMISIPARY